MGKMEEKRAQKRRAILEAAQEAFLSDGFLLANMDRIAAQAQVTKQTVYRYFPSKTDLFRDTLRHMGEHAGDNFLRHLQNPDTETALEKFSIGFVKAHMSDTHLETFRLLIAESTKAPELVSAFFEVGPDDTGSTLATFFRDRLNIEAPETALRQYTGMLLAYRTDALLDRPVPDARALEDHARTSTRWLLSALENR